MTIDDITITDDVRGRIQRIVADEEDAASYTAQTIVPIISEGEPIGAVLLLTREPGATMGETELKAAKTAANFMGKQMEQ